MSRSTPHAGYTLLVVTHDSGPELARLLDSVARHLHPRPPLVVVDNASRDSGASLARAQGARVISLEHNVGFGAANNAGLADVRTPVTALVNPDVELLDDGLARLAGLAGANESLLVPRLLNEDGTVQRSAHPLPGTWGALLPALLPAPLLPAPLRRRAEPWRAHSPRTVGWAIAACLVAATPLLARLGPFDERIFMFFEDLDLCLRARAEGVPTELRPEIVVRHRGGHATRRRYGGEPHEEMARRRREVLGRDLSPASLARDDVAQGLTFASRALAKAVTGGGGGHRERAQLRALLAARRPPHE